MPHTERPFIPVYEPFIGEEEEKAVVDSLRQGWVFSAGPIVKQFEDAFAARCGPKHAIAVSTGTAALHLALAALRIGPGDEVLVPSLTFVATANAVTYTGATPVFVDVEPGTWTVSPEDASRRVTPRTRAILPVHLYGQPARMPEILQFARQHGLKTIEDAAEAHFATIGDRCVGTFGDLACFSFYGNKIITTGEGGMVTTGDDELAERVRHLRGHAQSPARRYWHDEVGFNYRLTSVQAAIGLAQLAKVDHILHRKRAIAETYRRELKLMSCLTLPSNQNGHTSADWLFTVLVDPAAGHDRDALAAALLERGIETRPTFVPLHQLPPYQEPPVSLPVSERIGAQGLSLPSSPRLTPDDVEYICATIRELLG